MGSEGGSVFSLQITNVSIADNADFECQVGPANYNSPIRGMSRLTVLRKCVYCLPVTKGKW